MALSLIAASIVVRKALGQTRTPGVMLMLEKFFREVLNDQRKNEDLYYEAYSGLNSADQVIADAACKLFVLFGKKPAASTTDAWLKGSDHATVAAANGDVVAKYLGAGGGGREHVLIFPNGLSLGTGLTLGCHTTVSGNTKSAAADAVTGFAVIGAA
jgi:hypothetical protein